MNPSPFTPDAIREQIVARLCETLSCSPERIDPHAPFASYGLGSRDAVVLSGDLEEWLGHSLSPTVFYEHPTVDALVAHLSAVAVPSRLDSAAGPRRPSDRDPIAIIGLSCRFPGAPDADAFWKLLLDGRDGVQRLPAAREALIGSDIVSEIPEEGRWGGFVEDVDAFDAPFFGIGAAEAESMDPQQRLLLELSWDALEDAGQSVDALNGSATGVFVGISTSDYALLRARIAPPIDTYFGTSNSPSVAAGRVSYTFGFHGPTLAIDTACSSSLVAVHLACHSLQRGEADLALAGGVNLMLAPETTTWACRAHILSDDGQCKTFDAAANGYVRGEGCGVVVLKRLADALAAGDPIVAVIRGSAINHDGRSSGLTAPNGRAQQRVIAQAMASAGAAPHDVHYVEAHGTGTVLGDPIEIRALGATLCDGRPSDDPLVVSSVKTNIGHLEAAAGIAGLIKAALVLRHGIIPPHLHLQTLNPYIASEQLPIVIPVQQRAWPSGGRPRLAAVSSFGLSGTNAHVVLEPPPDQSRRRDARPAADGEEDGPWLLPISARSEGALRDRVTSFHAWLTARSPELDEVSYTACVRRAHHRHRIAVLGQTRAEMTDALSAWLEGRAHPRLVTPSDEPPTADGPRHVVAEIAEDFVNRRAIDWSRIFPRGGRPTTLPAYPFQRHRYWLPRPAPAAQARVSSEIEATILSQLRAADPNDREALLVAYLREQLARGLQIPTSDVPMDKPMSGLGLDSLMAIDIANRLAAELKVRVPPVDLMEKMTLASLASLVLDLREAAEVQAVQTPPARSAGVEEFVL
jgi:acyl transferase domain-containing protein